jgi:ketosteroid isomerase-like protein
MLSSDEQQFGLAEHWGGRTVGGDRSSADRAEEARCAVTEYLRALERFDVDAAVACFTEDVEYSHAPFRHQPGTGRRVARGRDALRALFEARGPRPHVHEIEVAAASGARAFVSGFTINEGELEASFISDVELAPDGLIATYVGYSIAPAARLPEPAADGRRLP